MTSSATAEWSKRLALWQCFRGARFASSSNASNYWVQLRGEEVVTLSPDEVLGATQALGVKLSRRTLQQWTKDGLVPEPVTGSLGRGRGRFTDYPSDAPAHAAAAWWLLSGRSGYGRLTIPAVREWRSKALDFDRELRTRLSTEPTWDPFSSRDASPRLHIAWLVAFYKARQGMALELPARVIYRWQITGTLQDGTLRAAFVGVDVEEYRTDVISLNLRRTDV